MFEATELRGVAIQAMFLTHHHLERLWSAQTVSNSGAESLSESRFNLNCRKLACKRFQTQLPKTCLVPKCRRIQHGSRSRHPAEEKVLQPWRWAVLAFAVLPLSSAHSRLAPLATFRRRLRSLRWSFALCRGLGFWCHRCGLRRASTAVQV